MTLILFLPGCKESSSRPVRKQQLEGQISVSGAFALYPLTVQWANEFQEQYPNVRINVSSGGAGKGMTDVLNGMVDFAMLSRELHQEERDQGAIAITVGRDAVVPVINEANPLKDTILRRGITSEDARKIWVTGEIRTWGQLLGTDDSHEIGTFTRSDACGAAQTWAAWFGAKQEDLGGTAVYGDPGIATAVGENKWGLGYNNIAYAYDSETDRPQAGLLILPVDKDEDGSIEDYERFYGTRRELVSAIEKDLYPMPPARNLYLVSKGAPSDTVSAAFLRYVMHSGQRFNEPAGYVRISKETYLGNMKVLRAARRGNQLRKNNTDNVVTVFLGVLLGMLAIVMGPLFFRTRNGRRIYRQRVSSGFMFTLVLLSIGFLLAMIGGLYFKSLPILQTSSLWDLLSSSEWKPTQGKFGFWPFISGTLAVTAISIVISVPIAILTSAFLTEYSPKIARTFVFPALDILAALPSVIYGVWGILILIPVFGYSLLTASLVLCVMILPIMVSLMVEIFASVPQDLRDASTSLGATQWQTTSKVVIRKSLSGIFAAVVLAVSKAMGETIAVMMVCGSIAAVPTSLMKGFYTLPALIGNNYGEMASVPLYESAIMFAALILLVIVVLLNVLSRVILYRVQKSQE